jgi:hypothetical protein
VITATGIWGIICAIIVLAAAFMMKRQPDQHGTWGVLILAFSVLSLPSGGGFIVGLLLGLSVGSGHWCGDPQRKKPEVTVDPQE